MNFRPEEFVRCLYYMGVGMAAIFAVILMIMIVTVIVGKLSGRQKNDQGDKNNAE